MGKIRIVLIEDDALTRMALRTALQRQNGIKWLGEATTGKDGLALLTQCQPDIGIVDIGLPELDGIELTRQFKASQTEQRDPPTKILILTLQDDQESVMAAFAAGADSYCMKNIKLDLLLEALKITQEGNTWIDPAIARIVLSQVSPSSSVAQDSIHSPKTVTINAADPKYSQLIQNYPLTERELEVLQLIVEGYSNAEIAQALFITVGTVKTHVRSILTKLCADDRTQAAVRALRAGLVG